MNVEKIIEVLEVVKCIGENQYMAKYPYHNDKKASKRIY